jgi:hypothetical protein
LIFKAAYISSRPNNMRALLRHVGWSTRCKPAATGHAWSPGAKKKKERKKENSAEEPSGMDDACLWCHGELKKEDPEARRRKLERWLRTNALLGDERHRGTHASSCVWRDVRLYKTHLVLLIWTQFTIYLSYLVTRPNVSFTTLSPNAYSIAIHSRKFDDLNTVIVNFSDYWNSGTEI